MKKLLTALAFAAAALVSLPANALVATGNFTVTLNLFPRCIVAAGANLPLRYVSFQTTASTNNLAYTVQCTTSLPYAMAITSTPVALLGLNYTLGTSAATSVGTGVTQAFNVVGTIAAGQGGTCATVQTATAGAQDIAATGTTGGVGTACTATSAAQTLTITY